MIDSQNPLYMVNDVYNGILVRSNMLGETMYYGKGAGKLPTASAVVADVIDAAVIKERQPSSSGTRASCRWQISNTARTVSSSAWRAVGRKCWQKVPHISALWSRGIRCGRRGSIRYRRDGRGSL